MASQTDIIDLNVGGKRMTTTRATLCQIKESRLANLFADSFESLQRDKDGLIFLDYNPKQFALILDYLRAKEFSTPGNPASLPKISSDEKKTFKMLVQHLGLGDDSSQT